MSYIKYNVRAGNRRTHKNLYRHQSRNRRGMAMVYIVMMMFVMVGFCSFAVDLGRVVTAKTQLRSVTDSAALAAACALAQGDSAAQQAAINIAATNKVDGTTVTITAANVTIGVWNSSTHTFSTGGTIDNSTTFQAVQVKTSRTKANSNPIPLTFASILGISSCDVTASSVAALIAEPSSTTQYVSAHGDIWLAGEAAGTTASEPDPGYNNPSPNSTHAWKYDVANPSAVNSAVSSAGSSGNYSVPTDSSKVTSTDYSNHEPYASPSGFLVSVVPGSVLQISVPLNTANESNNQGFLTGGTGDTMANGDSNGTYTNISDDAANPDDPQYTLTTSGSEHGISNIITPLNSMVGVFMDKNGATHGADSTEEADEANSPGTPAGLDFSTQAARDYTTLSPKLNQSFYIGNGTTSTNIQQTIVVPPNTYELFIGAMDGHEWSNNVGGFNATITQYQVQLVQ